MDNKELFKELFNEINSLRKELYDLRMRIEPGVFIREQQEKIKYEVKIEDLIKSESFLNEIIEK